MELLQETKINDDAFKSLFYMEGINDTQDTIVGYTYIEVEEMYELYAMLLYSVYLFSIVLLQTNVCVYLLILLENFIHNEVKHIAVSLIDFTAVS